MSALEGLRKYTTLCVHVQVIQEFYRRYNSGDVEGVMELMADDVEYHDLALYQDAFKGKAAVQEYFDKVWC